MQYRFWIYFLVALALAAASLSACSTALPGSATETPPAPSATPAATATPPPTATATALPPLVLLVSPGGDSELHAQLQTLLTQAAGEAGMRFQIRPALAPTDLETGMRLVVALPPDPGLAALAEVAPETQFLGVNIPALQPAPNLSTVGAAGARPDREGFLAGYIAGLVTPDYRVGVIGVSDSAAGKAARNAFLNGVVYYCGLCRPSYPPFYSYPLYTELPGGAVEAEQRSAADYLIDRGVKTVYVVPGAGDESLLSYLTQAGVGLIAGIAPPAGLKDHWVATIQPDVLEAVRDLLPELLQGKGGLNLDLPILVSDANPELFSPGRQRLAGETLEDLSAGAIDTGVDLQSGEPR